MANCMGGGAREYAPGSEEWMRLEAQPILRQDALSDNTGWQKPQQGVPFFAWPMLAISVLAISSAGSAFGQLLDVPAVTLAAWRLQLTTVILFMGAAWQWNKEMGVEERRRVFQSWRLLAGSGTCLAFHFGFWVWSLEHTTLTHSLLLVCSVPVLIAGGMLLLRKPVSKGEIAGSIAGFCGGLLLAFGPHGDSDSHVSLPGDMAALAGAVVFIGYLAAGRTLRQWMPIFVYAAPVTGLAAALLSLAAMAIDGASPFRGGMAGVWGWMTDTRYATWIIYLSFVPGIAGHTGFNTLLRWLTPLTVSLAFQLEPLFGTLIGWAAGIVSTPGWPTWVGGVLVLAAACVVTVATARREARQQAQGHAAVELEKLLVGVGQADDDELLNNETEGLLAADNLSLGAEGLRSRGDGTPVSTSGMHSQADHG